MDRERVKAVIQLVDLEGNCIGKPVEVHYYAMLLGSGKVIYVKDVRGKHWYLPQVIVETSPLEGGSKIPLRVYGLLPPLFIAVEEDKVTVRCPTPRTRPYYRKPEERKGRPMTPKDEVLVIKDEEEYIDFYIHRGVKEVGKEDNVPLVVSSEIWIRVKAKKLEEELYNR